MVKTELQYNPYIRDINILFNGQKPHINSQVEKYEKELLQNWVKKLPKIFYDEMNGYDFELEFTGTKLDFLDLVDAFEQAGVTDDQVHIFHKNELIDRLVIDEKLDDLILWMRENNNSRFAIESLLLENADLFSPVFPLIMIHGSETDDLDFGRVKVSTEVVNHVDELDSTNLENIPIVMYLNRKTLPFLQKELDTLLSRSDVSEPQMFFYIHSTLDQVKAKRIIQDLGIKKPQIVEKMNDDQIFKYLKIYPLSDYIYKATCILREKAEAVLQELQKEKEIRSEVNKDVYDKIAAYEIRLEKLKDSYNRFSNRDNLEIPEHWQKEKDALQTFLATWRNKKTKIMGEIEGASVVNEFSTEVGWKANVFVNALKADAKVLCEAILAGYKDLYLQAGSGDDFSIEDVSEPVEILPNFPNMSGVFQLRVTEYVEDKQDLKGFLMKMTNNLEPTTHPVTVFYYQQWRDYAINTLMPAAEDYMRQYFANLQKYLSDVVETYKKHLEQLIEECSQKKDVVVADLSEEEHALQLEFNWITTVRDRLSEIEGE